MPKPPRTNLSLGLQEWWKEYHSDYHREDGPAYVDSSPRIFRGAMTEWWIDGKFIHRNMFPNLKEPDA